MAGNKRKISSVFDPKNIESELQVVLGLIDQYIKAVTDASGARVELKQATKPSEIVAGIEKMTQAQSEQNAVMERALKAEAELAKQRKVAEDAARRQAEAEKKLADERKRSTEENKKAIQVEVDAAEAGRELAEIIARNQLQLKLLGDERKQFFELLKNGIMTQDQYAAAVGDIILKENALKISTQGAQTAIKNIEKAYQSADESLEKMRAELNIALLTFDKLSGEEKKAASGTALLTKIQKLTELVSKEEQASGRFQRNVGNYQGSAKIIVEALERMKVKLNEVEKEFGAASPEARDLRTQVEAIGRVTEDPRFLKISAKFGDSTQELRGFTKVLLDMENRGLKNTEAYTKLQKRLAELTDQIGDTKQEIKALSSDSRAFDLFAGSVNFAADSLQTLIGATTLLGASEEDAAETTRTLVAVQTLANGVKGIANELTTKGTAANKAYAFVQKQMNILFGEGTALAERFSVALKTIGLVAAIGLLYELYQRFKDNGDAAEEAAKDVEKLNIELERNKQIVGDLGASAEFDFKVGQEELKRYYAERLKGAKTDTEVQAIENEKKKALYEKEVKFRREALEDLRTQERNASQALKEEKEKQNRENEEYIKKARAIGADPTIDKELQEKRQERLELLDKDAKAAKVQLVKAQRDLNLTLQSNATSQSDVEAAEAQKLRKQREDRSKQELQDELNLLKSRQQRIKEANEQTAGIDVYSPEVRTGALTAAADAQKEILRLQYEFDIQQKDITLSKKTQLEEEYADNILKINQDTLIKIATVQLEYSDKQKEIYQQTLDDGQAVLDQFAAEDAKRLETQIQNLADNLKGQLDVIEISGNVQLEKLAKQHSKGKISKEKYEKEKLEIEKKALADGLLAQIDYYEKLLKISNVSSEARANAEKELAKLRKQVAEAGITTEKTSAEKSVEFLEKIKQGVQQVGSVISDALNAAAIEQKNRIQDDIDNIDKKTEKEIKAIEESALAEEEKENKIALLQARAQSQKEVLEQRQRLIDQRKAQFDKQLAISQIILNTAVAVVKAAARSIFEAIAVGALGAAQLAVAIATPIPRFKDGKRRHDDYEGPGYVGDGGKREMIIRENGAMEITPDSATLTYVKRRDVILPDARKALAMMGMRMHERNGGAAISAHSQERESLVADEIKEMKTAVVKAIKAIPQTQIEITNPVRARVRHGDSSHYLNKNLQG